MTSSPDAPVRQPSAEALLRIGLRKGLATLASLGRRRQSFTVDRDGHWANVLPEAVIVSPDPHFSKFEKMRQAALYYWTWAYMPQPGDTIIDVGAGIGEETVVFSKLVGGAGRVISIEAHPETYACLVKTVRRSGLTNVTPVFCALAEADGELSISTGTAHLENSVMSGGGGDTVPARSLDSLAAELGLQRVDLLKMNIEGAEKLAVKGMPLMSKRIHNLCISCHDFRADQGDGEEFRSKTEVRSALEAFGFGIETRAGEPAPWVRDYLYAKPIA